MFVNLVFFPKLETLKLDVEAIYYSFSLALSYDFR